jgi:hypothetical protein
MKIELVVGRNKDREIFEVADDLDPDAIAEILLKFSRPYLMSTTIDAVWNAERKTGIVLVGGFRTVGNARVLE